MTITERVTYLVVGAFVGFVLGYIVRSLREIKDEVHVNKEEHEVKKDLGQISNELLTRIALLLVVLLTAYSAFQSQRTNNRVGDVTSCNKTYLEKTVSALNQRTTFTRSQATANVQLQKDQLQFFKLFLKVPAPQRSESMRAFRTYVDSLQAFVSQSQATSKKVVDFPFPTTKELKACFDGN